jgi:hypothetical protein
MIIIKYLYLYLVLYYSIHISLLKETYNLNNFFAFYFIVTINEISVTNQNILYLLP